MEKRKGVVEGAPLDGRRKKFGEDVGSLRSRGYEGGGAVERSRAKAGAASLHGEEGLRSSSVGESVAEDAGEGGKLEGIKIEESRLEMERIASTETVRKLG